MEYRQVPYCTIGLMMGKLVLPTYKHYKAFARYRYFGQHRRGRICVPHKMEKPRRGNRPGYYPNYFLLENNQGVAAPYLNEYSVAQ